MSEKNVDKQCGKYLLFGSGLVLGFTLGFFVEWLVPLSSLTFWIWWPVGVMFGFFALAMGLFSIDRAVNNTVDSND